MSLKPRISARAETDLALQYRWFIDNAALDVAERYLVAFDARVKDLSDHPLLGRTRRFRSADLAGMRSLAVSPPFDRHLIFYKVSETELCIERVMHGARDLPRRLSEPPDR